MTTIKAFLVGLLVGLAFAIGACGGVYLWKGAKDKDAQDKAVAAAEGRWSGIASDLQSQLDHARATQVQVTETNSERIPHAVATIELRVSPTAAPIAAPRPDYFFTAADVMCWNSSLHIAGAPACPDAATSNPDAFAVTGTDIADAFANLNLNGDRCAAVYDVAAGWQRWYDQVSKGEKP